MNWLIYHNPKCSKSRRALEILQENEIKPTIIEYLKAAPKVEELLEIFQKSRLSPESFVRKNEPEFSTYHDVDLRNAKSVAAMIYDCPKLLERPIVVKDGRAIIARPPEKVQELLGS